MSSADTKQRASEKGVLQKMSVRVVARIRPLLKTEREADVIVSSASATAAAASSDNKDATAAKSDTSTTKMMTLNKKKGKGGNNAHATAAVTDRDNTVRIPNPKNESEEYSFQFSSVYNANAGQQELFDEEVAPTIKHLFNGFDVTLFAYGVTGTGKTHTMRGGKSLADRGVIPRLLSGIFRRSRKIEYDTRGSTKVEIAMSYYEIYNDKVFDLFEPPEKRTPSGLPLRDSAGKTVVVGLSERPCTSLKEFELLYDQANMNRSTSATKLNAHSSRSHAILCVKLTVTTGDSIRVSTASAIDLAGSEDNRRTENGKDRMVESASINKSLFVLAQCVEAMAKKQSRIPYRESKMTRILSLGQNNGLTIMILNLAPVRSHHLDTLTSLNFANRTKKVEVKEEDNQSMTKGMPKTTTKLPPVTGPSMQRQPLRPLTSSINANIGAATSASVKHADNGKPAKAFSVYTDRTQPKSSTQSQPRKSDWSNRSSLKRGAETLGSVPSRSSKVTCLADDVANGSSNVWAAKIEDMVQKKVEEVLAARAPSKTDHSRSEAFLTESRELNEQVQRRLESLEQRIEGKEDSRTEGLSYLLMGKQHQSRGEDSSALKMYRLAQPFFPDNEKLAGKIEALASKRAGRAGCMAQSAAGDQSSSKLQQPRPLGRPRQAPGDDNDEECDEYHPDQSDTDSESVLLAKKAATRRNPAASHSKIGRPIVDGVDDQENHSPRTTRILSAVNSRNVNEIKLLRGIGARKAEAIVDCLCEVDKEGEATGERLAQIRSLEELGRLKGVGMRTVETMRNAIGA